MMQPNKSMNYPLKDD